MNKGLALIGGVGLGAGLMYVLDPDRGRRRRAFARDKVNHTINVVEGAIQSTSRDIRNRARGVVASAKTLLKKEQVSDEVLIERVRSKLGRIVSHPHSVQVNANQGRITLTGPVLSHEVNKLINSISSLPGVTEVQNNLQAHERADVPGCKGV